MRSFRRSLRGLGVRYVVLGDAPADYSSRGEAMLLRSGSSGLLPVLRSGHLTVYEVPHPTGIVTGRAPARLRSFSATRMFIHVTAPGRYRVAVRFSPYWRTFHGCVQKAPDGMTELVAFRPGVVDLDFKVNVHRGLEALTGLEPRRYCRG